MTEPNAAALADELHAFCAAAPHDYPGHNIELFERVESFLRPPIPVAVSRAEPLDFFSENVDAWGALEWFNRLATAIRQQDAAVLAKDDVALEICRNVAASSAMRFVRDYEQQVRAALSLPAVAVSREEVTRMATAIRETFSHTHSHGYKNNSFSCRHCGADAIDRTKTKHKDDCIVLIADAILSLPLPLQLHDRAAGVG